jgi:diguanylate cyclase (GGDEF)-like protein
MELESYTLETVMFWVRFQHWGIHLIAPAWLLFALSITGHEKRITPWLIAALSLIPLILFGTAQTLGTLNLMHHNPRLDQTGLYPVFIYDRSIFNMVVILYYSLCLGVSTILFVFNMVRAAASFRKHAMIYLIGSAPPWAGLLLHNLNVCEHNLDLTPLMLGLAGLVLSYGFLRFKILDIIPLAREIIFEKIGTGLLVLDKANRIIDFNPALQGLYPTISSASVGRSAKEFIDDPLLQTLIQSEESDQTELSIQRSDSTLYFRVKKTRLTNRKNADAGQIISFDDFTQEKELLVKLEKLATQDGLTGLLNRQHFDQLAENEISRFNRYGGNLAMIMLDLDHFKKINDTYGHAAGDLVLIAVAEAFKKTIRKADLLARYGGEEFVILLPETDLLSAKTLAERLHQSILEISVKYYHHNLQIDASFGVVGITNDQKMTLEDFYTHADRAMYQAKAQDGNRICVNSVEDPAGNYQEP